MGTCDSGTRAKRRDTTQQRKEHIQKLGRRHNKKAFENLLSMRRDSTQRAKEAEASPFIESSPKSRRKGKGEGKHGCGYDSSLLLRWAMRLATQRRTGGGHKPMTSWPVYCGAHPDPYNMTSNWEAVEPKGRVGRGRILRTEARLWNHEFLRSCKE